MKRFWWIVLTAIILLIAYIVIMSGDSPAYSSDNPCSCFMNPNDSSKVECWRYEKRGDYTYAIHCDPKKPIEEKAKVEIIKRIFVSDTYAIIGVDNSTDLGYERALITGISNEIRFYNIWFLNDFVISPGDKIGIEGGHWLTFTNHSYYEFNNNYLLGAGFKYHYVNTSTWDKNAVFGLISIGYMFDKPYVQSKITLDYIYGTYDDMINSTQQGLQLNSFNDLWNQKIRIITGIDYYVLSCNTCNRQDAWSALIAIGVKI